MGEVVLFGFALAVGGLVALLRAWHPSDTGPLWEPPSPPPAPSPPSESGLERLTRELNEAARPLRVRVNTRVDPNRGEITEVGVFQVDVGISFRAATRVEVMLGADDVETGDPAFDQLFHLEGPEVVARALMDQDVRRGLLDLMNRPPRPVDLGLYGRELRVALPPVGVVTLHDPVEPFARRLIAIAKRLDSADDLPGRLAENVVRDTVADVRLNSLRTLLRERPDYPADAPAMAAALGDADDRVRVTAAAALGPAGHETLLEMAKDRHIDVDVAATAVAALGGLPAEQAEPVLLAALRRDAAEVRLAAAQALGSAGTAAAVLPLQQAAELHRGELRAVARRAIGAIQERLSGAAPGQVTLAPGSEGHVSLADGAAGQVSLRPRTTEGE
jgi:hypothetical protein